MDNGASSYRRFLDGDPEAFEQIMVTYRQGLIFFIDSFVHDSMVAEDIAIDVFTYILLHPRAYNGKTQLKTYLYMLGRSRALDYLRRNKRFVSLSLLPETDVADRQQLEDIVLKNEENRRLYKAISALPEDMKTAVYLVYFEGLSYDETSAVMKRSKKQIDNLLYRAKKLLSVSLKGGEQLV